MPFSFELSSRFQDQLHHHHPRLLRHRQLGGHQRLHLRYHSPLLHPQTPTSWLEPWVTVAVYPFIVVEA
jgi:hypothetical protein